jgi:dienelactone hydrolase
MGAFKAQGRIRQNTVKVPSGVYYPTLVAVTFAKGKLDFRIVLNGKNQVAGLRLQAHQDKKAAFPVPSYVNKKKFLELRVKVGKGKYPLDARLTLPHGQGKVPGVVLVHGSGAHDFDETIGPNKPFRDLAWGLSSRGVAVLRYVKRNKAWASVLMKRVNELTLKHEVLDDAIQAARQLLSHPRVHKVFIVGHSLGGYAAPLIAQKAPKTVSGIVILAGNARPLETLILEQYRYILGLDGKYTKQEKAILAALKKKVKRVQSGNLKKATAKQLPLGLPPKYWAFLRSYSQTETAFQIKQPILVMQGGRDYQVTKKDFQMWKSGLSSKSNVSFKLYPTLNHLFMFGKGRSTPQEYRKAGHVSLQVIKDVVNWVLKN